MAHRSSGQVARKAKALQERIAERNALNREQEFGLPRALQLEPCANSAASQSTNRDALQHLQRSMMTNTEFCAGTGGSCCAGGMRVAAAGPLPPVVATRDAMRRARGVRIFRCRQKRCHVEVLLPSAFHIFTRCGCPTPPHERAPLTGDAPCSGRADVKPQTPQKPIVPRRSIVFRMHLSW